MVVPTFVIMSTQFFIIRQKDHLKKLKQADLIYETKEKNFIYYELNTSVLEDIMVWLADLKGDHFDEDKNQ